MKIIHIIGSTGAGKTEALKRIVGPENVFYIENIKNKLPSQTCIGIDDVRNGELPDDIYEFLKYTGVTRVYLSSETISNKGLYKNKFEKITTGESTSFAVIFNIDGVLSNLKGKNEYDTRDVLQYEPNFYMIFMLKAMRKEGLKIIFTTTRSDSLRKETIDWLQAYEMFVENDELFMRAKSDKGPDVSVEYNRAKELAKIHNIMFVFCIRNNFTDMYRQSGFHVLQTFDNI